MNTSTDETRNAGADVLATDGSIVRLRGVRPEDGPSLVRLYGSGSPESLRLRFFGPVGEHVISQEVDRLTRAASGDHDVVVAELAGQLVGVAAYEVLDSGPAEFAVFVDEAHHDRGIGTLLLERLTANARRQGVTELVGEVLSGNNRMLRVARDLTGQPLLHYEHGLVDVRFSTTVDDEGLDQSDARDRVAESASLRPLLAPSSVAVVGAGRTVGSIGYSTLQALLEFGFTGRLAAVNPHAEEILGVPSYPTVSAIPGGVELVVIAVPAPAVAGVLADAGAAGARAAVILTAGFGEVGGAGESQAELVRIARRHSMRIVGPNCLGVFNSDPAVRLAATFSPVLPPSGGLALASQSGAVGIAVLDHAARTGIGVSSFVSLGNKADVSGNDLLAAWYDDPATSVVALYLESFGNPRRFARIARALGRRKPVIAVVSGRSVSGQRAGASHTAAAASPAVAVDTLCAQAGVIRVDHLGELIDTARMLTNQPLPAGDRIGIVGNAGGVNVLAADAAEAAGLRVPELSATIGASNPFDLGAGATPEAFASTLDMMAASGEVDALIAVVAATRANDVPTVLAAVAPVADRHRDLPVAVVVLGHEGVTAVGERRAPVFDLPERAVAALGRAARYAAWRREPLGRAPQLSGVDVEAARRAVDEAIASGGGWQAQDRIGTILRAYGIAVVETGTAAGADGVVAEAQRLGFPVVLKAADPNLVHKTDVGGVRLNLGDADQVRAAYREMAAALSTSEPSVLVQPMARGELELLAGIVHDRLFGSLVLVGLGGVHTELFADRAVRLVPMTDRDAGRMWRSLHAAPLLTGYRGSAAVDTAAVEDLILRLSRLADEVPEIAELDLNPVMAGATGVLVVDAKMRISAIGEEPDAGLRQLRAP